MNREYEISQQERELAIARLEISPSEIRFYSGGTALSCTKTQLIELIQSGDPVGNEYVKMDLEYLRALKSGDLMRLITS